jgi:hypothetical protein
MKLRRGNLESNVWVLETVGSRKMSGGNSLILEVQ